MSVAPGELTVFAGGAIRPTRRLAFGLTPRAVIAANRAGGFVLSQHLALDTLPHVGDELEAAGPDGLVRVVYRIVGRRLTVPPATDTEIMMILLDVPDQAPLEPVLIFPENPTPLGARRPDAA